MHSTIVFLGLNYIFVVLSASSTSTLRNNTLNSDYFYYVSTGEGLISHLSQLYAVWLAATIVHRSIYVCGFHSGHYGDVKSVNICDLFRLPSNINCTSVPSKEILSSYNCSYTSGQVQRGWTDDVKQVAFTDINFKQVQCIAGSAHTNGRVLSSYESVVQEEFLAPPFFTNKYLELLPTVKSALGLGNDEYMTVHWRRGDHLTKRCGKTDFSMNCGNVTDFVKTIRGEIKKLSTNHGMRVYVATNEANPDIIDYLHNNGIEMNERVKRHFERLKLEVNSLDLFMIDLMLMCDAKYFMGWGITSSIDTYFVFKYCRNPKLYAEKITIHDGKITNGKHY